MVWEVVGLTAASLTMFGFLPQLIKIYHTKSAHDLSPGMIVQLMLGTILWLSYGIHLRNFVIILANGVTFCILTAVLALFMRFNSKLDPD